MLNVMALKLSETDQRLVHSLQALGDTTRYKMFKLLQRNDNFCVSEIAERLEISPSAVSQHFRTFELLGIVRKERNGQKVCYVLNEQDQLSKKLLDLTKE